MIVITLFLNLLLFGLIIFGIVRLFSRSHKHIQKEGSIRRFFQLILLFGLAIISSIGVSGLLGRLIRVGVVINNDRGNLAMESAFALIGVPLFVFIALWARKSLQKDADEAQTLSWNLYLTSISIISLILIIDAQMNLYSGLFTDQSFRGKDISQLIVWGALWAFHFRMHNRIGRLENSLGEHLIGSLIGLGFSFVGLLSIFTGILNQLFGLNESLLFIRGESQLINGLITLAVGAPIWFIYWIRTAEKGIKESLWYAYVLLIGVGGGLLATLISVSLVLNSVLVWFFGEVSVDGREHFRGSSQLIGTALAALIILWYHRQVLQSSQEAKRTDIRRIYEYVISAIGLLAASGGVTMILVSIIESMFNISQLTGPSSINSLLGAITLTIVGGPVWWLQWSSLQKEVKENPDEEQSSFIRRIYLLVLFGVVGVTTVVVLITATYLVFYDLFQNGFRSNTINRIRFPLAIFLTAAVVSTFHLSVYRAEKNIDVRRRHVSQKQEKLYFLVQMKTKPRSTKKVIDVLNEYAIAVRKEIGCEGIDVLIDPKIKNTIYIYEIWRGAESHQKHIQSSGFLGWKEYSDPLITSLEIRSLQDSRS